MRETKKKGKQEQLGRDLEEYLANHIAPVPLVLGNLGKVFADAVAPVGVIVLLNSRYVENDYKWKLFTIFSKLKET